MFPAMTSPREVAADIGEIIVDEMLAICSDICSDIGRRDFGYDRKVGLNERTDKQ